MVTQELERTEDHEGFPRGRPGVSRQSHREAKERIHGWVPVRVYDRLVEESVATNVSLSQVVNKYLLRGLGEDGGATQ